MSGASLSSLLSGSAAAGRADAAKVTEKTVDAESETKLEANRSRILTYVTEQRPRFVVAFETMTFSGNAICITVPSESLRDEIEHASVEILTRIAAMCGISGALEFRIKVAADKRKMRPIKLEDRVKHIETKNPLVAELRKRLELDAE